ncbi:chemosensory receptor B [Elysia marginata]|uniref:Chemosensory receptor B n=1 Tax=Elysia marginata TaxID=1093978 RepID=A0AAV4FMK7_9GAST|nr:chemosensory receptor B [Elysia marginata]
MDAEDTTESWSNNIFHVKAPQAVSTEEAETFELVNYVGLGTLVCTLGIVSNIINLLVYHRIGFKESIIVSLLALTISDLGLVILQLYLNFSQYPALRKSSDVGLYLYELSYSYLGVLRSCFTRISTWITVLITIERCVCIVFPTKVRDIFTPKKSAIIVVIGTVLIFVSGIPIYSSFYVGRRPVQGMNRTRISVLRTSSAVAKTETTLVINLIIQVLSLSLIGISVSVLLVVLHYQKRKLKVYRPLPSPGRIPNVTEAPIAPSTSQVFPHQRGHLESHQVNQLSVSAFSVPEITREHVAAAKEATPSQHVVPMSLADSVVHQQATPAQHVVPVPLADSALDQQTARRNRHCSTHACLDYVQQKPGQYLTIDQCESSQNRNQLHISTVEPSTSFAARPSIYSHDPKICPAEVVSGLDTVARLTQQRMWRCGRMVAILSLIVFASCIPSALLLIFAAADAFVRYGNTMGL